MKIEEIRQLKKVDDSMWIVMQFGIHNSEGFESRRAAYDYLVKEGFCFHYYIGKERINELWIKEY